MTRASALHPVLPLVVCLAMPSAAQPSLDDLLDLSPGPEQPAEPAGPGAPAGPVDLSDLAGRLEPAADAGDAFLEALTRMDAAAGLLEDRPDGLPAARAQEEILDLLDQVLAAAAPPPGGGGGGGDPSDAPPPSDGDRPEGAPQPGPAGPSPGAAGAPGPPQPPPSGAGDGAQDQPSRGAAAGFVGGGGPLESAAEGWGGLPARLRDELTDGLDEPFSPVYRDATEEYYRLLSRRAAEAAAEGQP